ncbi:hypothetical protein DFA_06881 [Cavenderia fasciculata]|uniref:HIT-type domain-containing protein n=1 Tax=Cavenderia fasciculata TaxID=261658 RepID=F4PWX7_CACFS|nr:uncharacterized protein DFA_06881 [Cavenderia fasciculata]EGG19780.1 hypothetical protein DFA_06881 [Cavenderia fasciculata]|eukprot:XP_004358126.1 hypothetical protein DFA_06881 [Cavenderia fasciculata]
MIDSLIKFILKNKQLRVIIFQHVTSIHRQLGIRTVKSKDIITLYDYIKYGQTDLFIKHFDRLHQLILLVDKQSRYKKNNHVAMKYLIDRLGITKKDFQSYKIHFSSTTTKGFQFTTEMFYVLRDANFSTLVPSLQHGMINVLIRLGDSDQLESYLSTLDNPNPSSTDRRPFKSSFSYLLANNNNNKDIIYTTIRIIEIFKRYSINVIGDVLVGAVENNHLEMVKWVVENVPNEELADSCKTIVCTVFEVHGKKEVLEMLPISHYANGWHIGSNAIKQGNFDFIEYYLKKSLQDGHVIKILTECLAHDRMDCFELIVTKYQNHLPPGHQKVIHLFHPNCFSTELVARVIKLGFHVRLCVDMFEPAIRDNQLETFIELDYPHLPLTVDSFTRLLGYAIECNSLSSIDVLLHHPRFQEVQDRIIDISCIKPQTIPTIEYIFDKSNRNIPIRFQSIDNSYNKDYTSSYSVDYESVAKVIRLVYRPNIIGRCQLIAIFLLANDIEWLFDNNVIAKDSVSTLVTGLFSDYIAGGAATYRDLFKTACLKGQYPALDFLFDNCLPIVKDTYSLVILVGLLPDDQQFERYWSRLGITDTAIVSDIVQRIIFAVEIHRPKRVKSIVDIYGTLYTTSRTNGIKMSPINYPPMKYINNHPIAHYSTLMEVFCSQKVPWIKNYSKADELIIFQKAISFGYILPIPSFLDNNNNDDQSNQNSKYYPCFCYSIQCPCPTFANSSTTRFNKIMSTTQSWFNQYTDDDNDDDNDGDEEVVQEEITTTRETNNKNITIEQIGEHRIIRDNDTGNITIDLHSLSSSNDNKRKAIDQDQEDDETSTTTTTTITSLQLQPPPPQVQQQKIGVDKCTVCQDKISKYRCPGCFILFCSMICLGKHKTSTECTGVRRVTQFIPLDQMTDRDIVNENINRVHESGKNLIDSSMVQTKSVFLQKAAFKRMINLYIMPKQMSRHKDNTSNFRQKENLIYWKMEWNFVNDLFKIVNDNVCETDSIKDIILKHINDPVNRYELKKYFKNNPDSKDPILLMKRERCTANQYYRIPLDSTLSSCLQYKELIEFPSILVINQHELVNYPIVDDPQQLEEIQKEQKEIIQRYSKVKYDPNLVNTHDQINSLAKSNPVKKKKKLQPLPPLNNPSTNNQNNQNNNQNNSNQKQQQNKKQSTKSNNNNNNNKAPTKQPPTIPVQTQIPPPLEPISNIPSVGTVQENINKEEEEEENSFFTF